MSSVRSPSRLGRWWTMRSFLVVALLWLAACLVTCDAVRVGDASQRPYTEDDFRKVSGKTGPLNAADKAIIAQTNKNIANGQGPTDLKKNYEVVSGYASAMATSEQAKALDSNAGMSTAQQRAIDITNDNIRNGGPNTDLAQNYAAVVGVYARTQAKSDAEEMYKAMKGVGTDESSILNTLKGKSQKEIDALNAAFDKVLVEKGHKVQNDGKGPRELEKWLKGETSGGMADKVADMYKGREVKPDTEYFYTTKAAATVNAYIKESDRAGKRLTQSSNPAARALGYANQAVLGTATAINKHSKRATEYWIDVAQKSDSKITKSLATAGAVAATMGGSFGTKAIDPTLTVAETEEGVKDVAMLLAGGGVGKVLTGAAQASKGTVVYNNLATVGRTMSNAKFNAQTAALARVGYSTTKKMAGNAKKMAEMAAKYADTNPALAKKYLEAANHANLAARNGGVADAAAKSLKTSQDALAAAKQSGASADDILKLENKIKSQKQALSKAQETFRYSTEAAANTATTAQKSNVVRDTLNKPVGELLKGKNVAAGTAGRNLGDDAAAAANTARAQKINQAGNNAGKGASQAKQGDQAIDGPDVDSVATQGGNSGGSVVLDNKRATSPVNTGGTVTLNNPSVRYQKELGRWQDIKTGQIVPNPPSAQGLRFDKAKNQWFNKQGQAVEQPVYNMANQVQVKAAGEMRDVATVTNKIGGKLEGAAVNEAYTNHRAPATSVGLKGQLVNIWAGGVDIRTGQPLPIIGKDGKKHWPDPSTLQKIKNKLLENTAWKTTAKTVGNRSDRYMNDNHIIDGAPELQQGNTQAAGTISSNGGQPGTGPRGGHQQLTTQPNNQQQTISSQPNSQVNTGGPVTETGTVANTGNTGGQTGARAGHQQVTASQPNTQQQTISSQPANQQPVASTQPANQQPVVSAQPNTQQQTISSQPANQQPVVSAQPNTQPQTISSQPANQQPVVSAQPANQQPVVSAQPANQQQTVSSQPNRPQPVVSSQPSASAAPARNGHQQTKPVQQTQQPAKPVQQAKPIQQVQKQAKPVQQTQTARAKNGHQQSRPTVQVRKQPVKQVVQRPVQKKVVPQPQKRVSQPPPKPKKKSLWGSSKKTSSSTKKKSSWGSSKKKSSKKKSSGKKKSLYGRKKG